MSFEFFYLLRTVLGIISFYYHSYHHRSYLDYVITELALVSLQPHIFVVLPCSYYRLKKMNFRSP